MIAFQNTAVQNAAVAAANNMLALEQVKNAKLQAELKAAKALFQEAREVIRDLNAEIDELTAELECGDCGMENFEGFALVYGCHDESVDTLIAEAVDAANAAVAVETCPSCNPAHRNACGVIVGRVGDTTEQYKTYCCYTGAPFKKG